MSWLPIERLEPILLLERGVDGVTSHEKQLLNLGLCFGPGTSPKGCVEGLVAVLGGARTSKRCGLLGGS